MNAAIVLAEEAVNVIPGQPWMYGVGALGTLVLALFLVSRLNPNR